MTTRKERIILRGIKKLKCKDGFFFMHEIETKILEVDVANVKARMVALGAQVVQNTRLFVDWYCHPTTTEENHPWYLRVRTTSDGKSEICWKSLPEIVGNTRQSKEITVDVSDVDKAKMLLEAIGLTHYAHQEKDRISYVYKDWNFDLDQYPGMPAYLEIEGKSSEHVEEAIKLLDVSTYQAISEGERKLIQEKYGLDWSNMRFKL
jgi:adenylate cyclase class 2